MLRHATFTCPLALARPCLLTTSLPHPASCVAATACPACLSPSFYPSPRPRHLPWWWWWMAFIHAYNLFCPSCSWFWEDGQDRTVEDREGTRQFCGVTPNLYTHAYTPFLHDCVVAASLTSLPSLSPSLYSFTPPTYHLSPTIPPYASLHCLPVSLYLSHGLPPAAALPFSPAIPLSFYTHFLLVHTSLLSLSPHTLLAAPLFLF